MRRQEGRVGSAVVPPFAVPAGPERLLFECGLGGADYFGAGPEQVFDELTRA